MSKSSARWGRVYGSLHSSAKWAIPKGARALWITAMSWCIDQKTDGVVPVKILRRLDGTPTEARQLVDAGLWQTLDNNQGWKFHEWDLHNRSVADMEADAEKKRKRMAELRSRRQQGG